MEKGSATANAIAHVLEASGLTVGLYTSPFIMRFNERIMIDHEPIPDAAVRSKRLRLSRAALERLPAATS